MDNTFKKNKIYNFLFSSGHTSRLYYIWLKKIIKMKGGKPINYMFFFVLEYGIKNIFTFRYQMHEKFTICKIEDPFQFPHSLKYQESNI